jgi:DUF2934 family protein
MKQSIGGKSASDARTRATHGRELRQAVPRHARSAAIISPGTTAEPDPDPPFVEGAQDAVDPDLRQRMISEAAYHRFAERGYADGYDVDDWLQAEAEVDQLLLAPRPQGEPRGGLTDKSMA